MLRKHSIDILAIILATIIASITLSACSEEKLDDDDDDNEPETIYTASPTEDVIETTCNTPVSILSSDTELLKCLRKRLTNIQTEITADTRFVIFDENSAIMYKNNTSNYDKLDEFWHKGGAIGCINPGKNWYNLFMTLHSSTHIEEENNNTPAEYDGIFDGLDFHATTQRGVCISQDKLHDHSDLKNIITIVSDDDETSDAKSFETAIDDVESIPDPTEYDWGKRAESIVKWFNNYDETIRSKSKPARSGSEAILEGETFDYDITLNILYDQHDANPTHQYFTAKVQGVLRSAHKASDGSDIYDIVVQQKFPGDETWQDQYSSIKYYGAYRSKHAGCSNAGLSVGLSLHTQTTSHASIIKIDPNKLVIWGPVPLNEAGNTTTTHDPGGWTLGGGLTGGYSGDPNISIGFTASYSLPKTTTATIHPDIPVKYSIDDKYIQKWDYTVTGGPSYSGPWGSNRSLNQPKEISKQLFKTEQAVTFQVKDSEQTIGTDMAFLRIDLIFKAASAWATPFHQKSNKIREYRIDPKFIRLPNVLRSSAHFIPTVKIVNSESMDADAYAAALRQAETLQNTLKNDNITYARFANPDLTIGAPTRELLLPRVSTMWRALLHQLIEFHSGIVPLAEYNIVLVDEQGKQIGDYVKIDKQGVWSFVAGKY